MNKQNISDHKRIIKRLDGFYGVVCQKQNQWIMQKITGRRIMEVGCGYGTFIDFLKKSNFQALGIDIDAEAIRLGKERYGNDTDIKYLDVNNAEFCSDKFDSVVFRESAHHLDLDKGLAVLERAIRKEVIIFDPNPNFLLKTCRRLIGHMDTELDYRKAIEILSEHGFKISFLGFRDIIAFPLSGGFVGKPLVPNFRPLWAALLKLDEILLGLARLMRLERYFCWRYTLIATKNY